MPAAPVIIGEQIGTIARLCRHHHVCRLEPFGSAASGRFNLANSDLDFLVDFLPLAPADRADAYFGLLADLQDLFGRDVDLVESAALTNPYFKKAIDANRTLIYAA
jgi:predicted nucleotidyltransferase